MMLYPASPLELETAHPASAVAAAAAATAAAAAVPPPTVHHHASRSSTPGVSSLDGTPRYLHSSSLSSLLPSRPRSVPPSPDMTVQPDSWERSGRLDLRHRWLEDTVMPEEQVLFSPTTMPRKQSSLEASPTRTAVPDEDRRPNISLSELSHLLRVQKYQKRLSHQSKERLHYLQIAAARVARLTRAATSVQHTLAECIRSEDKPSFVSLLHAFHDACDLSLKPTSATIEDNQPGSATDFARTISFLDELSSPARVLIIDFLSKIRYDSAFLANHLVSLTHKELLSLLPDRLTPKANESVLGSHSGLRSRTSRPLGFVVDAQVDHLSSFTYSSPLEALIFATRGVANSSRLEDDRATEIWATVCAKLISDQKAGSERLIPAILDIWSSSKPWPGKTRLETWILQTLQRGAFLLEHPAKQSFRARMEGRSDISADEELRADQFYTQAATSLLVLLGESTGSSVVPPGALKLCEAVSGCLSSSPRHQKALPHFVVTRWLFSTFIQDAVACPEAYGMLTDHYISEISRQRILREVASRAQKSVFDVAHPWKTGAVVSAETMTHVNTVMAKFQVFPPVTRLAPPAFAGLHSQSEPDEFLIVSARDVLMSLNVIYPQRRPASVTSDGESIVSGLLSSSSSISGLSMFRHASESESYSELSEPAPRGMETSYQPSVGSTILDDVSDASQMRDACLELEDVIATHSTANGSLWDVLLAQAATEHLELAQNFMEDNPGTSVACEGPVTYNSRNLANNRTQMVSCAKAVETLLREHEIYHQVWIDPTDGQRVALQNQIHLEHLFQLSIEDCEAKSDFVSAHQWYQQLLDFQEYIASSFDSRAISDMLLHIESSARDSMERTELSLGICDNWTKQLDTVAKLRKKQLQPIAKEHDRLRDKLWYIADVRTSAAFEEARMVAAALRVMGKTKKLARTRMQPPLRHWNGSKLSGSSKTEAQILEILGARPEHGGPNKLSDDISKSTELWMNHQNVDNICKGEERLHKLCMEVRKCVDSIMDAPNENSTIWSNSLFAQDEAIRMHAPPPKRTLLQGPLVGSGQHSYLTLQSHVRSNDALSSTSQTLSSASSRDFLDMRSPALTHKSSVPFWSPVMTENESASSATSIDFSRAQSALESSPRKQARSSGPTGETKLDVLRQRALSLVLSDLTSVLFSDGSETDRAFWSGLGWTLTDRYLRSMQALHTSMGTQTPTTTISSALSATRYRFEDAFSTLFQKFSATSNPHTKLACLSDIDKLLVPYMAEQDSSRSPMTSFARSAEGSPVTTTKTRDAADASVAGFRAILSKSSLRPTTIFRDLQYIAALLPSSVLQNTPEGKAFCNAVVAIFGLKQEARSIMVEMADSIIAYHSNNRGHGRASSTAQQQRDLATFATPVRTPSAEDVSRYDMVDAAYLLQITAKEGDAVAQRELATLYLTHPELMDPIIAPFARPKDVFKDELESKWRKTQDPSRCDPATMCVAHHWMSLSSRGGDSLAKEYLRQREEMDSF